MTVNSLELLHTHISLGLGERTEVFVVVVLLIIGLWIYCGWNAFWSQNWNVKEVRYVTQVCGQY